MDTELDFTGKTILVTGSGRNIGRAIILEFAGRGANVIINARVESGRSRSGRVRGTSARCRDADRHGRRRPISPSSTSYSGEPKRPSGASTST